MTCFKHLYIAIALTSLIACKDDKNYPDPTFPQKVEHKVFVNPPDGWVGDLMPYYINGQFELFFLHDAPNNVKHSSPGQHPIFKYTSKDLTSFDYAGEVINYGSIQTQDHLIGTGSYVKSGNTNYFYYTGFNSSNSWLRNANPGLVVPNTKEAVMYATSTDFKQWTKNSTFIMRPPADFQQTDFRDPYVFYNEEFAQYWMLVSAQKNGKGYLLKYTSANPANNDWAFNGTLDVQGDYLMLECADIFKIGSRYYLLFAEDWSGSKGTHYRVANSTNGPWVLPPNGRDKLDGHQFYAAKTASDGTNRYAFGWAHRRTPETNDGQRNWGGNLIFHQLGTDAQGNLTLHYAPAIDKSIPNITALTLAKANPQVVLGSNQLELNGLTETAQAEFNKLSTLFKTDFKLSFNGGGGDFNLVFKNNNGGKEYTININANNDMIKSSYDGSDISSAPIALDNNTNYQVRVVVDGSICVVYLNNQIAFTNRIYGIAQSTLLMQAKLSTIKLSDFSYSN